MRKALVILSGGQDSTYCLAWAKAQFDEVAAITFDYGQRHNREINAAKAVAALVGVTSHEIVKLGDDILQGTSPLTDKSAPLEQYQDYETMDKVIGNRIEKTFVPMRNALFLNLAANRAACMGANHLVTGVCEQDNANYPDCRLSFIMAQQATINAALGLPNDQSPGIFIKTPLISKTKAEAIEDMIFAGTYHLLAFTHTAYDGQYPPIGHDHATLLRAQGFIEADVPDPLMVRAWMEGALIGRGGLPETPNYEKYVGTGFMLSLQEAISANSTKLREMGVKP